MVRATLFARRAIGVLAGTAGGVWGYAGAIAVGQGLGGAIRTLRQNWNPHTLVQVLEPPGEASHSGMRLWQVERLSGHQKQAAERLPPPQSV